ncbi:MAG: hypothetical protein GY742_08450 [Hyphomicrobiales bacterium]|nr:hypothetical protein [Hyphomicrobiales bacterium]
MSIIRCAWLMFISENMTRLHLMGYEPFDAGRAGIKWVGLVFFIGRSLFLSRHI